MDDTGAHVEWFRKPWLNSPLKQNHCCHRKVLIVDEGVAFTGRGPASPRSGAATRAPGGEWRDTTSRSAGWRWAAFAQNWAVVIIDRLARRPRHHRAGGRRPVASGRITLLRANSTSRTTSLSTMIVNVRSPPIRVDRRTPKAY